MMRQLACALLALAVPLVGCRPAPPRPSAKDTPQSPATQPAAQTEFIYPRDGTLFPPGLPPPKFRWQSGGSGRWRVSLATQNPSANLTATTSAPEWRPDAQAWRRLESAAAGTALRLEVVGLTPDDPGRVLTTGAITFRFSADPITDAVYFREVVPPFRMTANDVLNRIRYRSGSATASEPPPIVLKEVPVCTSCHSVAANAALVSLALDTDGRKDATAIISVGPDAEIDASKLIRWETRNPSEPTIRAYAYVSPDGRHLVAMANDRHVLVDLPDPTFSFLFFQYQGVLATYDRATKKFRLLTGASDPTFVHTGPTFSPDGQSIVFSRTRASHPDPSVRAKHHPALVWPKACEGSAEECARSISGRPELQYDLVRVPFNDGAGGTPVAIQGASGNGSSNFFPRISPDGRWLVFCRARNFMALQRDAELWIVPAAGGAPRRMRANTPNFNGWHSFSSDGRWLLFSTKWLNPQTRLAVTHIDANGEDSPPVLLEDLSTDGWAVSHPEFVKRPPAALTTIKLKGKLR